MKLPKPDLPRFKTTLPYSQKEVTYRPYTIKEEKIITMSMTNDDPDAQREAIFQVMENCCQVDPKDLHEVDFEWLSLKLLSVSTSPIQDVTMEMKCVHCGAEEEKKTKINLDDVKVAGMDELQQQYKKRKDSWVIEVSADMGLVVSPVNPEGLEDDEFTYRSVNAIYEGETVYDEFSKEDLMEWLDGLQRTDFEKVQQFFDMQPFTYSDVSVKCSACGGENITVIRGVIDFLE